MSFIFISNCCPSLLHACRMCGASCICFPYSVVAADGCGEEWQWKGERWEECRREASASDPSSSIDCLTSTHPFIAERAHVECESIHIAGRDDRSERESNGTQSHTGKNSRHTQNRHEEREARAFTNIGM